MVYEAVTGTGWKGERQMKAKIEFSHKLTVLNGWATNPNKDTISALSEKQAREAVAKIKELWSVLDRRAKR